MARVLEPMVPGPQVDTWGRAPASGPAVSVGDWRPVWQASPQGQNTAVDSTTLESSGSTRVHYDQAFAKFLSSIR